MSKVMLLSNPRKRRATTTKKRKASGIARKARKTTRATKRRSNPIAVRARTRRTRRRNPSARSVINANVMPALKGAVGAVAIDMGWNALAGAFVPAQYRVGNLGHVVKAVGVVALGMGAEKLKLVKGPHVRDAVNGALTVQFHGIAQELLGSMMGGVSAPAPAAQSDNGVAYMGASPVAGEMPDLSMFSDAPNYDANLAMFTHNDDFYG